MKQTTLIIFIAIAISSCETAKQSAYPPNEGYANGDTLITQSLFNDKAATISEENIQRVLDGTYKLPRATKSGHCKTGKFFAKKELLVLLERRAIFKNATILSRSFY